MTMPIYIHTINLHNYVTMVYYLISKLRLSEKSKITDRFNSHSPRVNMEEDYNSFTARTHNLLN